MDKFSIPSKAKPYIDALKALIRPGVSASPDLEASVLIDMPVVLNKTGSNASAAVRVQAFIESLEYIAQDKLKGKDSETAHILFALGTWAGVSTRDRNAAVAKLHNEHWTWDNYRKEPLERHLFAVYLALYRAGENLRWETMPVNEPVSRGWRGQDQRPPDLIAGGNYILTRYELFYNFPAEPGQSREFVQIRDITASIDGVEAWRQTSRWWGKNIQDLPELTLFGPGKLFITHDQELPHGPEPARIYVTEVRFPEPLMRGQGVRFVLIKRHAVEFDDLVREGWRDSCGLTSLNVPTEMAVIGVRFPKRERPRKVWHYEDLPDWLLPGVASEANQLTLDGSGFVAFTWDRLFVGYSYGLAWEW